MTKYIALLNGPNLNLLGTRNPTQYGADTLDQIVQRVEVEAKKLGHAVWAFQSNSEGELIDAIHKSVREASGIIINPAAYSHTSVAIRDALECMAGPVIEVHLSNIAAREDFRHRSYVSPVASGVISGFGSYSYVLAIKAMAELLTRPT